MNEWVNVFDKYIFSIECASYICCNVASLFSVEICSVLFSLQNKGEEEKMPPSTHSVVRLFAHVIILLNNDFYLGIILNFVLFTIGNPMGRPTICSINGENMCEWQTKLNKAKQSTKNHDIYFLHTHTHRERVQLYFGQIVPDFDTIMLSNCGGKIEFFLQLIFDILLTPHTDKHIPSPIKYLNSHKISLNVDRNPYYIWYCTVAMIQILFNGIKYSK